MSNEIEEIEQYGKICVTNKMQVVNDMFGYVIQDILTPYGDNKDTEDTNESEVE